MHRPLGRAAFVVPASLSLGFTAPLARPPAYYAEAPSEAFVFCLAHFVPWNSQNSRDLIPEIFQISGEVTAKCAKHSADSLPRKLRSNFTGNLACLALLGKAGKNSLNNSFYFILAAAKNL